MSHRRPPLIAVAIVLASPLIAHVAHAAFDLAAIAESFTNGGVYLALVMAFFGVASAFISDEKVPKWLLPIWNLLASNYRKARNDPRANE